MKQAGFTAEELGMVTLAKSRSDALIDLENVAYHAMIGKYRPTDQNVNVNTSGLTAEQLQEFSVSAPPNQTYAMGLVHGLPYHREKAGIMKPIDDFFARSEERLSSLDGTTRTSSIISVLGFGVIAILTGLLIYTSIEHWRSIQQCRDLYSSKVQASRIAESISGFRLEEVEYLNELENPDELQVAFLIIAGNLKLYKPYLPSHLIDGDSDESDGGAKQSTCSGTAQSLSASTATSQSVKVASRLALGLDRRPCTIVAVSNKFAEGQVNHSDHQNVCKKFAQLSNWLFLMSSRTKGNLSMSPAGVFYITYRGKISSAMDLIHHSVAELEGVTFGCCHSKDVCGNIGGDFQRGFVNLGQSNQTAEVLSSLAARLGLHNLIEEKTSIAVPGASFLCRSKVQMYDNYKAESRKLKAFTLLAIAEAAQEEWMYDLCRNTNTAVTEVNEAIGMYLESGERKHRDLIPETLKVEGKGDVDMSWVHEAHPFPTQVCFMSRVVSLHPDTAETVRADDYRKTGLIVSEKCEAK